MPITHVLTPLLRVKLKQPLGTLVRGSFTETMKRFSEMVDREKPPVIVSVGDTVSKNLAINGFAPQLSIVDNKCMRKSTRPFQLTVDKTVYVKNPQGTITDESMTAIRDALKSNQHVKMVVDGEEDLLTLIAVAYAPENSLVIYGQPYEGVVVVKVTADKKAEISGILKDMEKVQKAK